MPRLPAPKAGGVPCRLARCHPSRQRRSHRLDPLAAVRRGDALDRPARPAGSYHAHFALVPDRSAVLVEARSSVGPLTFGVIGLTGSIETRARWRRAPRRADDGDRDRAGRGPALGKRHLRRRAAPAHRCPPLPGGGPRARRVRAQWRARSLPGGQRGHDPRCRPPSRRNGRRGPAVARPVVGDRRAGGRYPRLRHQLTDGVDAADLPGRGGQAVPRSEEVEP